jgi:hypothetical protein
MEFLETVRIPQGLGELLSMGEERRVGVPTARVFSGLARRDAA